LLCCPFGDVSKKAKKIEKREKRELELAVLFFAGKTSNFGARGIFRRVKAQWDSNTIGLWTNDERGNDEDDQRVCRQVKGNKMIMNAAIRTLLSLLLLSKIAALGVSRYDERDIRNENDFNDSPPPRPTNLRMDPAVVSSDLPLRLERGVSFTRTISQFPSDAAFAMSLDDDDCKQRDVYGDNDCHLSWGQNVTGNFKVKFSDQIEESDYIVGDFKVRDWSPFI
jgi:hypothetical protein